MRSTYETLTALIGRPPEPVVAAEPGLRKYVIHPYHAVAPGKQGTSGTTIADDQADTVAQERSGLLVHRNNKPYCPTTAAVREDVEQDVLLLALPVLPLIFVIILLLQEPDDGVSRGLHRARKAANERTAMSRKTVRTSRMFALAYWSRYPEAGYVLDVEAIGEVIAVNSGGF
ncbi:hypothetical protein DL769_009746 [Monosporascus sp. CRB-8-3]|nr:hypothetical protein DL769_009746 [Monosporascus sp. CRB-8-3]